MPTILQLRRGSTAENDAYTGSVGEITVDTTLSTVRLHDGSTAGGSLVGNLQKNIQIGITGDNEIDTSSGNLTIDSAGGTVTIDDNLNISGTTTVSGHILPDTDVTYDLGSSSFKFRDIYLSGTSINLGSATITASGSSIVLPSGSTISGGTGNLATESYVDTAVANVIDSAPGALDTLNELAAALGDDANYASTTTTALSNRLRIDTNAQGLTSTQKSNAITNLGLSTVATSGSYTDLSNTSSVVTLSGTQTLTNKTISSTNNTITITESNISDLGSYITASSSDTLTNKSGNISQWTNDTGYLTSTNINTSTSGSNALITLTNSAGGSDSVTLAAGSNITISESGDTITIASTASGSALTIQDEGSTLTTDATTLNFVGAGVTASGSGSTKTITISGGSSYTDSDVNTHLNTSTASSGEVLSWNGSDYDWVAQSGGGSSLTIQDEGSTLTTDATTLNFTGAGVTASGTGSTKTINIPASGGSSTLGGLSDVTISSPTINQVLKYNGSAWVNAADATASGSSDLGAVAEDILPSFDEVYDIGSSTFKWYDGFFTNSINLDTIALENSSGTLSINSDVTVGSLLADSLFLSENTITADASTALQYLGDKGVVEINNSNLDVREGDWIGVPVVETTNVVTSSSSSSSSVVDTTYASSTDYSYAYFDSFQNRIEIEADTGFNEAFGTKLLNLVAGDEIIFNYYNAVDDEYGGPVTLTLSATPTYQASPKRYFIPYSSVSPSVSGMAPDVLNISISETVITTTTTNTTTAVPPLTTGSEGIIRYNKDEGRFEGYNAEGWASLGGLEKDADGNNTVAGNLIVSGDITSTSDKTLKDNIKSIEGALDIVTKLSGKMFTMKSDETQKEKVGFIAQEIEQHLPQVVSTDPNGIKSVSYGNVAALLVEAIKELNQKIEDLKK